MLWWETQLQKYDSNMFRQKINHKSDFKSRTFSRKKRQKSSLSQILTLFSGCIRWEQVHGQQNLFTELPTCESESAVGLQRGREGGGGGEEAEWHSGNNLLNLLLHLPVTDTHPDPRPVAGCEKAPEEQRWRWITRQEAGKSAEGLRTIYYLLIIPCLHLNTLIAFAFGCQVVGLPG